mmetsp:Transcript_11676/g.22616  ORF Transcript_11676/g.22616 Transcript_11676/m.22616 type:complete len:231 (-) Transcript_11676:856-1548(-)
MISFAAVSEAISSLKSSFSSFLCSVASITFLSSSFMEAFKTSISSANLVMLSCALSIAISKSDTARSSPFFLSSAASSSFPQYSFFASSSSCSIFSVIIMSSIILMTLSNPTFFPSSAKAMKPMRSWPGLVFMNFFNTVRACRLRPETLSFSCIKLDALGSVFLKSSKASSSFKTLIVSARAASSSARVFTTTSHSFFLVSQFSSRFAKNCLSAARDSSVSPKSFFICAI